MSAKNYREWERPLLELEEALDKLRGIASSASPERRAEIELKIDRYERGRDAYIEEVYGKLGPWEKVLVARADKRPYSLDFINGIFKGFFELQGDRLYGADNALIGGPAELDGSPCMVIGHQKGRTLQERQFRNFGMAKPEGYRKAIRLAQMADRFGMPVVTFVDTPAADPGVDSETRGIAEAIASSMLAFFELSVPIVSVIIGEGGSGGAIGICTANRVLMLEHAIYSVIPPEGCAAILWRQPDQAPQAASALQLTAASALRMNAIDEVVPEPMGGAHRDPAAAIGSVREAIVRSLHELRKLSGEELKRSRRARFRALGELSEPALQGRSKRH